MKFDKFLKEGANDYYTEMERLVELFEKLVKKSPYNKKHVLVDTFGNDTLSFTG